VQEQIQKKMEKKQLARMQQATWTQEPIQWDQAIAPWQDTTDTGIKWMRQLQQLGGANIPPEFTTNAQWVNL
jgi:hypothetical protein